MLMDNNIDSQANSDIATSAPAPLSNSIIDTPISPENPTGSTNQAPKKKSKAGLIIGIIIGVLVLAGGIVAAIFIINYNQRLAWHRETAEQLLEAISSSTNEKSVFFAKDFAELSDRPANSPYSAYDDRSYVAKYDDNVYLCLNNDDTKISGQRDNLTISGMNGEESCRYNFQDGEREAYLHNYINQKYGYAVDKSKTSTEREDTYLITTDKGVVYASLALGRDTISVTDDHETLTTDYANVVNLHQLVRNRTLVYIRADDFTESTVFPNDIVYSSTATVPLVQAYIGNASIEDAKDWLSYISDYLKNKPVQNATISAWALDADSLLLDSNATYRYVIALAIRNGVHKIVEVDTSQISLQNVSME